MYFEKEDGGNTTEFVIFSTNETFWLYLCALVGPSVGWVSLILVPGPSVPLGQGSRDRRHRLLLAGKPRGQLNRLKTRRTGN